VSIRRVSPWVGLIFTVVIAGDLSARERVSSQLSLPSALVEIRRIKADELLKSAQALLPKGAFLGPLLDDNYAVISHEWLARTFLPAYRVAVGTVKDVASREAEGADCDNYGMFLRQMVGLAGIVGHTAEPAAAQVVVFQTRAFAGVGRTQERHAVVLFFTDRGWMVLEPQTAEELVPFDRYANRGSIRYITFH